MDVKSLWHLGAALTAVGALFVVAAFVAVTWGIWTSDERGVLCLPFAFGAFLCFMFGFTLLEEPRPPRLSRHARRHLRAERERIELARLISEAEKEAGLS